MCARSPRRDRIPAHDLGVAKPELRGEGGADGRTVDVEMEGASGAGLGDPGRALDGAPGWVPALPPSGSNVPCKRLVVAVPSKRPFGPAAGLSASPRSHWCHLLRTNYGLPSIVAVHHETKI